MMEQIRSEDITSRVSSFPLKQKDWLPYAFVLPAVLVMSLISIYPAFTALRVSLFDMNLLRLNAAEFIGLDNYVNLFRDEIFIGAMFRTLRWTVAIVAGQMALALPVALFLNLNFALRGVARTIVLLPYIIPSAVVAIIWIYMFDANFGVMNEILLRLGLIPSYLPWIADPTLSFIILVLAMIWWGMPFMAIMLLAALQSLDEQIFDAARIDGANVWQRFRYITLPQLMPTILVVLLLRTMWMSHHIDTIFLMTDGGPGIANYTMPIYSFMLTSTRFEVGYGSAVAVVLAIILLGAALGYIRSIEKSMEYL